MILQGVLTIAFSDHLDYRTDQVLLHRSGSWRDIAVFVSLSSADEFSCKVVLRRVPVLLRGCAGVGALAFMDGPVAQVVRAHA
jgi:hypothetical protein